MSGGVRAAKVIRIITVPPVMAAWLILALWLGKAAVVLTASEAAMSIVFLSLLPLMAYPVSALVPSLRGKGRDGQRNAAFALSLAGYLCGWIYVRFFDGDRTLLFIFGVYVFSVIILLLLNKVLRLRASGHACSVSGPILVICFVLRGWWIPICLAVFAASFWGSVKSGRHTAGEYLLGTLSVLLAIGISWCIYLR